MRLRPSALVLLLLGLSACDSGPGATLEPPFPDAPAPDRSVAVTVDTEENRYPISPFIYGTNQPLEGFDGWTVRRLGGNRMTGYNWENDFSNAGADWFHTSDDYMMMAVEVPSNASGPARVMTTFHDRSRSIGATSILTIPVAGYVAADGNGAVSPAQTAPSSRWHQVLPRKPGPFANRPNLNDDVVYIDEFVRFMTQRYGTAATESGVRWYHLDNEPGLWSHTHPRLYPDPVSIEALVTQSQVVAAAVKDTDPTAGLIGPALFGMSAFDNLQEAPDWGTANQGHRWFVDYYLARMAEAEARTGRRLLDVFDVHWYPEARGDSRIVMDGPALSPADIEARLQAPRTLWDPNYVEDSWIGQWRRERLPLLPTLQAAIDAHYPGTPLAITEYNYGGGGSISGALAQADVLGLLGRHQVYLANLWRIAEDESYLAAAFRLYRDYDGDGGQFGDTHVRATTADPVFSSVYAAVSAADDGRLHLIMLNKGLDAALGFEVTLNSSSTYRTATVWTLDADAPTVRQTQQLDLTGNTFTLTLPAATAAHVVLF